MLECPASLWTTWKGNLTNDGTYKYTYDCENRLTDVNTVANVRVASYTYDYLGRRISKTLHASQTTIRYHYDGLGSVIALSNNSGSVIEKYSYDAFGAVTIRDAGDQILTTSNFGNCRMFTGRELDSETGNYYYRARYYSPDLGRFLSPDPIGIEDTSHWDLLLERPYG